MLLLSRQPIKSNETAIPVDSMQSEEEDSSGGPVSSSENQPLKPLAAEGQTVLASIDGQAGDVEPAPAASAQEGGDLSANSRMHPDPAPPASGGAGGPSFGWGAGWGAGAMAAGFGALASKVTEAVKEVSHLTDSLNQVHVYLLLASFAPCLHARMPALTTTPHRPPQRTHTHTHHPTLPLCGRPLPRRLPTATRWRS